MKAFSFFTSLEKKLIKIGEKDFLSCVKIHYMDLVFPLFATVHAKIL